MSVMNMNFQKCVVCGEEVEVNPQVSASQFKYTDLDSRPRGSGRFIEKNYVQFCHNCGYSAFHLSKDLLYGNYDILKTEEYQEIVKNEKLIVDAKKFYLLGLIQESNHDKQKASIAFLRSAWFFQDDGNIIWMKKSKLKAIENMVSSEFTWKNEQSLSILVDMYRTIGMFDEAINAIDKFGFDNVKDEEYKKLLSYQIKLCNEKDFAVHASYEVEQNS